MYSPQNAHYLIIPNPSFGRLPHSPYYLSGPEKALRGTNQTTCIPGLLHLQEQRWSK